MTAVEHDGVVSMFRSQDPDAANGESLTWADIRHAAADLVQRWRGEPIRSVYGVPTGGAPVAVMVAQGLSLPLVEHPDADTLVVDDLIDTGRTLEAYQSNGHYVDALYRKPWSPKTLCPFAELRHAWLRFPWEREDGAPVDAVTRLLQFIGEDPTRDGLLDTPRRVVKALSELTAGYREVPGAILSTTFDVPSAAGDLVVVARVPFASLCEHHMLPFVGVATVGYVPSGRVVGLSKLARLVDCYARRLQVQERLTLELADAIEAHLEPLGVGVAIDAQHSCMSNRGVRKEAPMMTSTYRGVLAEDVTKRAEFLSCHRSDLL
jgi:GTP cyclohydrolase I